MQYKTKKIVEYLKERDLHFFDIESDAENDILHHTESIDGISLKSLVFINDFASTEIVFMIAQCSNIMKHEQMILFLNELNCHRQLKYFMRDGYVVASFYYYADNNDFNPDTFISLYAIFLQSFSKTNDISKIMKLIWS